MLKIYTAGPISGQSYDQVVERYKEQIETLTEMGYRVFCPMTGKVSLRTELEFKAEGYEDHPISNNHAIIERDRWMVKLCDVILCDLSSSGDRVSIGSMMELAWAHDHGIHTITIIPDGNIHEHAFVLEATDIRFRTLNEAYEYLAALAEQDRI